MEPSKYHPTTQKSAPNRNWGGLILILIGLVFLVNRIPGIEQWIPSWIFSWPMILVVVGLCIGINNRFKNAASLILIGLGIFFLLDDADIIQANLRPFLWPTALIILGFVVLFKRNKNANCNKGPRRHGYNCGKKKTNTTELAAPQELDNSDRIQVNAAFGSVSRALFSKNFQGGNITATFGGAEINLSKCDFPEQATIDLSIAFGGVELITPANWKINSEVNVIMGGIEDKRNLVDESEDKVLTLRGSIICGGLELKSF